jgi:hypothetical protein
MSAPLTVLATAVVRAWTWIYTRGTPVFVRDGRRQEIESDLWEQQHDLAGEPDARVAAETHEWPRKSCCGCWLASPTTSSGGSSTVH